MKVSHLPAFILLNASANADRPQFGRRRIFTASGGQSESSINENNAQRPLIRRRRVTTTNDADVVAAIDDIVEEDGGCG